MTRSGAAALLGVARCPPLGSTTPSGTAWLGCDNPRPRRDLLALRDYAGIGNDSDIDVLVAGHSPQDGQRLLDYVYGFCG